jgi:hypothetical protein
MLSVSAQAVPSVADPATVPPPPAPGSAARAALPALGTLRGDLMLVGACDPDVERWHARLHALLNGPVARVLARVPGATEAGAVPASRWADLLRRCGMVVGIDSDAMRVWCHPDALERCAERVERALRSLFRDPRTLSGPGDARVRWSDAVRRAACPECTRGTLVVRFAEHGAYLQCDAAPGCPMAMSFPHGHFDDAPLP